jgi:hypothetical protein
LSTGKMTSGSTAVAKKVSIPWGLRILDGNRERGAWREELNVLENIPQDIIY